MPRNTSVFVGNDIPGAPVNVKLIDNDGTPRITWEAPTKGANGEYINSSLLTYDVLRNDNSFVARGISGTSYDDTSVNTAEGNQKFGQYAVRASSSAGTGAYQTSNAIIIGEAYSLPFAESFPSGTLTYKFWGSEGNDARWSITNTKSSDEDQGCAVFTPSAIDGNSKIYTGKIDLRNVSNITLGYDCYATPGTDTKFVVELRHSDQTFETIDSFDMSTLTGNADWQRRFVNVPLDNAGDYGNIFFSAISGDGSTKVYLDNISVSQTIDYDLYAGISAKKDARTGSSAKVNAIIKNVGGKDFNTNYDISLIVDDKTIDTHTENGLALNQTKTFEFAYPVSVFDEGEHQARIIVTAAADQNSLNNTSNTITIKAKGSNLPTVENLAVRKDDTDTRITWTAPSLEGLITEHDDVESYEPFAIDNIGDWTMADVDGSYTFGIAGGGSYLAFPHAIEAKSWIVFNAPESGATLYDNGGRQTGWVPRSGSQMFVSFQDGDGATDDWMISPELAGHKQILSFYVKSINPEKYGCETFEVMYSTTDNELESFNQITNITGEAPANWTEINAELPEGTKYFAIRGTSSAHFALLLDDITYSTLDKSELDFKGYNVYVDRQLLNATPVEAPEYIIPDTEEANSVDVTAVYAEGESLPMNIMLTDGIDPLLHGSVKVSSSNGAINIENLNGSAYSVYDMSGQLISKGRDRSNVCISLSKGVYVVNAGNRKQKVTIL